MLKDEGTETPSPTPALEPGQEGEGTDGTFFGGDHNTSSTEDTTTEGFCSDCILGFDGQDGCQKWKDSGKTGAVEFRQHFSKYAPPNCDPCLHYIKEWCVETHDVDANSIPSTWQPGQTP